jgi:4,4'-diaponeurosporenoate glycosyltransferase
VGPELILLFVALALWVAGWWVVGTRDEPPARPLPNADGAPGGRALPVSIIIPARNEECNLPVLLRSINAQAVRPLEVIVVDDGSTDRTAEVARQLGATVIASQPLPDGWRGKTWACHQGAEVARGDLLLFLDADTWFEPDGLSKILSTYNGGALSVGPYHAVRQPYEQLSAFFNLVMIAGTVPGGLFGQMLVVDRESYRRVGGHETVKGRTLENCFLASRFREAGITVRCLVGRGALSFRMYPNGLRELIEGWTKGFAAGAGQTPSARLLLIVAWLTGMMLAVWSLSFGLIGAAVYLLYAVQLHWLLRRVGAFRWYTAMLYPVPLLFYFIVFTRSALRSGKQVTWKGRAIHAD